ncbi:MAG: DUF1848 family protein [Desulfobacterales bacterium]|nr:DUF1848 family protein [Desulfobacterales bacterium]
MKIVISASRRTDIPAFYMEWMMGEIEKGFFTIKNPYNSHISIIPSTPDKVHTIVFWSKNFKPFIYGDYGKKLLNKGFNLFFNFTINSESKILEPAILPLSDRLHQLEILCSYFDPITINWRFDPICFYKIKGNKIENNLGDFIRIAEYAGKLGIKRCITSFMDNYKKIQRRVKSISDFSFIEASIQEKIEILLEMEKVLKTCNINLYTCCEKEILEQLPENSSISKSSCIPNEFFIELFGGDVSIKKDTSQRMEAGCGCKVSHDIGLYKIHRCYNNCLYCYANPA